MNSVRQDGRTIGKVGTYELDDGESSVEGKGEKNRLAVLRVLLGMMLKVVVVHTFLE